MQNIFRNKKTGSRILLILVLTALMAFSVAVAGAAPDAGSGIDGEMSPMPSRAQGRSYIVMMGLQPAAVYDGDINGLEATKPTAGEKFDASSEAAEDYAAYSLAAQDAALAAAGVSQSAVIHRYTNALNGFSAILTGAQVEALERQPDVAMVLDDLWRQPTSVRRQLVFNVDDRDLLPKLRGTGAVGEDVIVGVIDSGIWPEHPSFADDGSYSDLGIMLDTSEYPACDFGNQAHNVNDLPFTCNNKLLGARQILSTYRALIGAEPYEFDSARDENGHGTHTASTAAGNSNVMAEVFHQELGVVSGIAPRARIIAYKGLGAAGGFSSDLSAAIDQAVADGVDVINYSIGGGASLDGSDDISFLYANAAGVFVATSAGNSGPGAFTIGGPGSVPWITTVGASTQNRFFKGIATLGDGTEIVGASITPGVDWAPLVDASVAGGDLCLVGALDPEMVAGKIVLCRRGSTARASKSQAVYEAGGVGMILYENSDDNSLFSDSHWVSSVHVDQTPGLQVKAYIAGQPNPFNAYVPAILGGTGAEVPGTPPKPAPTAMIVSTDQYDDWTPAPNMTYFSSRGPNPVAEEIIKPDITAPGLQILAGNSPAYDGSTPYKVTGELFQAIAGTSMSSPHVAGLFAQLKEVQPSWPASVAQSALMTTADTDVRDNDRVSPATPFGMGNGHANPGHKQVSGSYFQPGLVYYADFNAYLGFLCDKAPQVFTDPATTCAGLAGAGVPILAEDLNYPSIGAESVPGSLTVTRTVTSVAETADPIEYTAHVDAPEGYEVTVTPDNFSITPFAEQTFEVTFNNVDAPIGEWRFGQLTWISSDGTYSVQSQIAVKGSVIGAPDELEYTGMDGSDMFDVAFGYSGDYTAAAHGLVPATVTMDNVVQDPDQNFDPTDGFSNAHEFLADDTAFMRFAIPPEAVASSDIDIDIFLYDPDGNQYATSTNGGTDEQIDVDQPMDGTWTLYVHGWQTVGPNADYDLYSWLISNVPGGNLSIDSAPSEAVQATTGTVEFSWMGAPADWNLGMISHSDADGQIGMTLIDVDNRP